MQDRRSTRPERGDKTIPSLEEWPKALVGCALRTRKLVHGMHPTEGNGGLYGIVNCSGQTREHGGQSLPHWRAARRRQSTGGYEARAPKGGERNDKARMAHPRPHRGVYWVRVCGAVCSLRAGRCRAGKRRLHGPRLLCADTAPLSRCFLGGDTLLNSSGNVDESIIPSREGRQRQMQQGRLSTQPALVLCRRKGAGLFASL